MVPRSEVLKLPNHNVEPIGGKTNRDATLELTRLDRRNHPAACSDGHFRDVVQRFGNAIDVDAQVCRPDDHAAFGCRRDFVFQ